VWLGFGLSSGDILGQGCEATNWGGMVRMATLDPIPFNELIFVWDF
jgi:hypothetical protein